MKSAGTGVVVGFLQARYYSAVNGQFLSQDPVFWRDPGKQNLLNPQSFNTYSYANGNPINASDPNGEAAVTWAGFIQALKSFVSAFQSFVSSLSSGGGSTSATSNSTPARSSGGGGGSSGGGSNSSSGSAKPTIVQTQVFSSQEYNTKFAVVEEKLIGKAKYKEAADSNGPDVVDCSGAIIYGIRSVANPNFGDYTANELYQQYTTHQSEPSNERGSLIFINYNDDSKMDHVVTVLGDGYAVNPYNEAKGVTRADVNYLGGTPYYAQLNWQQITQ